MKLNNLKNNLYIFSSILISIFIGTLLWEKIILPFDDSIGARGVLVADNYNPINDTIRYIFFIIFPLIIFLFLKFILKKKTIRIREIIFENEEKIAANHKVLGIISLIFIIFIFLEFFSLNFPIPKLDMLHEGDFLTPAQNYLFTNKFWSASYTVHGGSDIFYPLLMWKIFGVESIGSVRISSILLTLLIKLLSVLLSYQLIKTTTLNKENKILFFTIFTSILISMSHYNILTFSYYFSDRDIYVILFLIFFIELFVYSKFKFLSTILISVIASVAILFHIDTGVYLNFVLMTYCFYLFFLRKYNDILLILSSLLIFWILTIYLIGLDEFKAFLDHAKMIALSIDLIHGLKYPEPFFSMGKDPDGSRATRGLLLQLTAGFFVLDYLISNNKTFKSKKIFFALLFLLSFIMYKNALGRSDSGHIRMANDLPILINCFFILNYLLIFIEKKNIIKKILSLKVSFSLSVLILVFFYIINLSSYKINNIKNFNQNFVNYINLQDQDFLDKKTIKVVSDYKKIIRQDNCVQNFTFSLALPYLLKKPSCTKYFSSWLASPTEKQKDYIKEIKTKQPKYILYESPENDYYYYHTLDGLPVSARLELVNSYILSHYKKYDELGPYIVLERK